MAATPDEAAPRGHTVHANGVNLYYEVHGQGPPLLLLHAGSLTADSWQPYLPAFAQHFCVYAPDSRPHGRSEHPSDTLSYGLTAKLRLKPPRKTWGALIVW
jgi:pimeloyl-ACP methyl ester carboxylesterase